MNYQQQNSQQQKGYRQQNFRQQQMYNSGQHGNNNQYYQQNQNNMQQSAQNAKQYQQNNNFSNSKNNNNNSQTNYSNITNSTASTQNKKHASVHNNYQQYPQQQNNNQQQNYNNFQKRLSFSTSGGGQQQQQQNRQATQPGYQSQNQNQNQYQQYQQQSRQLQNQQQQQQPQYQQQLMNSNISNGSQMMMYIPCMNCQELVHVDQVEKHSNTCVQVVKEVQIVEQQSDDIQEVNFKIQKLLNLFKQLIQDIGNNSKLKFSAQKFEQIANCVSRMYDLANKSLELKVKQNININNNQSQQQQQGQLEIYILQKKMLKDYYEQLKQMAQNPPNSMGIKLYLDRLIGLIKLKYSYINKEISQLESPVKVVPYNRNANSNNNQRDNRFQKQQQQGQGQLQRDNSERSIRSISRDQLKQEIQAKQQQLESIMRSTGQFKNKANIAQDQMNQVYQVDKQSQNQSLNNSQNSLSLYQQPSINNNNSGQFETQPTPYMKQSQQQGGQQFNFASPQKMPQNQGYNYAPSMCSQNTGSNRIGSDGGGAYSEISNTLSNIDSQDHNNNLLMNKNSNIEMIYNNDSQRIFYSKCISLRMRLAKDHPAQKIPITLLYKEAQNLGLQKNMWEDFIQSQFKQAEDYLDNQKIKNQQKNKTFTNNLANKVQNFRQFSQPQQSSNQQYQNYSNSKNSGNNFNNNINMRNSGNNFY